MDLIININKFKYLKVLLKTRLYIRNKIKWDNEPCFPLSAVQHGTRACLTLSWSKINLEPIRVRISLSHNDYGIGWNQAVLIVPEESV